MSIDISILFHYTILVYLYILVYYISNYYALYAGVQGPEIDSHWHALDKDWAWQSQGEKACSSTSSKERDVVVPVVQEVVPVVKKESRRKSMQ